MTGKVKRIIAERGFGFIESDEDKQEYFFHFSDLYNGLTLDSMDGAKVQFAADKTPKGNRARKIELA